MMALEWESWQAGRMPTNQFILTSRKRLRNLVAVFDANRYDATMTDDDVVELAHDFVARTRITHDMTRIEAQDTVRQILRNLRAERKRTRSTANEVG
jgi:hypothetical protein